MIGTTLGQYRIIEQIGQGGMARVYKAYDPILDHYVAVKVLPEMDTNDPKRSERFKQEARVIAKLEHARILPIYSFGEERGLTYLVLRYIPTGTLADRITERGPAPLKLTAHIIGQVASALDYAHKQGVLHRDVKPSNVLIDREGDAYLTDFGVAKMVEASIDLTKTGGILGTPAYMSPEQCTGTRDLSPKSDQYALGVVLYEMVTGKTPYQAETPLAYLQMHFRNEPLPLPRSLKPDLPEGVERVILKTLSHDPDGRYETCSEVAEALKAAIVSNGASVNVPAVAVEKRAVSGGFNTEAATVDAGEVKPALTTDEVNWVREEEASVTPVPAAPMAQADEAEMLKQQLRTLQENERVIEHSGQTQLIYKADVLAHPVAKIQRQSESGNYETVDIITSRADAPASKKPSASSFMSYYSNQTPQQREDVNAVSNDQQWSDKAGDALMNSDVIDALANIHLSEDQWAVIGIVLLISIGVIAAIFA